MNLAHIDHVYEDKVRHDHWQSVFCVRKIEEIISYDGWLLAKPHSRQTWLIVFADHGPARMMGTDHSSLMWVLMTPDLSCALYLQKKHRTLQYLKRILAWTAGSWRSCASPGSSWRTMSFERVCSFIDQRTTHTEEKLSMASWQLLQSYGCLLAILRACVLLQSIRNNRPLFVVLIQDSLSIAWWIVREYGVLGHFGNMLAFSKDPTRLDSGKSALFAFSYADRWVI